MGYVENLRKHVGNMPLILPGALVIIVDEDGRILLQEREQGIWGLPGGIMELGESYEETATREVKEETGLHVENLSLLNVYSGKKYYLKVSNGDELYSVTAVFLCTDYRGELYADGIETISLKFFDLNELPIGLIDSYREFIKLNDNKVLQVVKR